MLEPIRVVPEPDVDATRLYEALRGEFGDGLEQQEAGWCVTPTTDRGFAVARVLDIVEDCVEEQRLRAVRVHLDSTRWLVYGSPTSRLGVQTGAPPPA